MEIRRFDLSKKTFSGEPLSELENAKLREIIEVMERSRWMRKQAWIWAAWAVGAPSIILGLITGIKGLIALFVPFWLSGGK